MSPNHANENLSRTLAESGLRSTRQREVVYASLLKERDHPTAEEVFARVKPHLPSISLATVYNCLETLVQCSLVKQVNFDREPSRYCPNLQEHAHFHDVSTGRIYDVELEPAVVEKLKEALPAGFEASGIEINFRGLSEPAATRSFHTSTHEHA
ncbi:MAG: transcriptional repressor [Puniceicoccaceae bacterium]|nr:MAG: transcriptional repressor [Puniceicoccaceae bacterium]